MQAAFSLDNSITNLYTIPTLQQEGVMNHFARLPHEKTPGPHRGRALARRGASVYRHGIRTVFGGNVSVKVYFYRH